MTNRTSHWLLLAAISGVMFLTNLGATRLWDVDEAIFSQTSVEMYERGDWVTPYYNGEMFAHKPPLMYWCQIAAYHVFGETEFAARFCSALFGLATVIVTYELARSLFSARAGLWSGIVLASCINFTLISRAATPDVYLTFFCTLGLFALVKFTKTCEGAWNPQLPPTWRAYALFYVGTALAVLVKGPIGIILPMAVWGMFLLIEQRRRESAAETPTPAWLTALRWFEPRYFLQTVWQMRPLTAIGILLAVAGPWYVWVGLRTDGEFLRVFFVEQNFGRATKAMDHHSGPPFYYLVAMCIGTFPWCVLLAPAIGNLVTAIRSVTATRSAFTLLACWVCVWIGCFTLVSTKLPSYVIPAYPAVAIVFAALIDQWLTAAAASEYRRWLRPAWTVTGLVGVVLLVAIPVITHKYLDGEWTPALVGIVPLAGAIVGMVLAERGQLQRSLNTLAVIAVLFGIGLFSFAVLPIDAHQNSEAFTECVKQHSAGNSSLAAFHYSPPSLVYYGKRPVAKLEQADAIAKFFADHPKNAFLITLDRNLSAVQKQLPTGVVELKREKRFLKSGDVILLGRSTDPSVARKSSAGTL